MIRSVLLAAAILLLCINLVTLIWRRVSQWRNPQPTPRDTQDALSSRLDRLILHTCRVEERLQTLVEHERTRLLPLFPTPPPPPTPTSEVGDNPEDHPGFPFGNHVEPIHEPPLPGGDSDSNSGVFLNGDVNFGDGSDWSNSTEDFWDDADDFLFD